MADAGTIVTVGLFFIVLPLWIVLHYVTACKKSKMFSPEDEQTLTDLYRLAEKLEERVRVMERILDDEVPDWRSRRYDEV